MLFHLPVFISVFSPDITVGYFYPAKINRVIAAFFFITGLFLTGGVCYDAGFTLITWGALHGIVMMNTWFQN